MLSKTILGLNLLNVADNWNNKDPDKVRDIQSARQEFWEEVANAIIQHFQQNAQVTVTTTGTAAAQSGTGKIL